MSNLKFVGLTSGPGHTNPELQLATPSGQIRTVPLSQRDLARILNNVAAIISLRLREDQE